jgi:hypothetical protein
MGLGVDRNATDTLVLYLLSRIAVWRTPPKKRLEAYNTAFASREAKTQILVDLMKGGCRMRLTVPAQQARQLIDQIPHATCTGAAAHRWHVADDDTVRAQSVLWLFCWGKTGMGSSAAAREARFVFDSILPIAFERFDSLVNHEYARKQRYSRFDLETELTAILDCETEV